MIAERVRALRIERRWTQIELAERLGLSQGRISQLERGRGSFSAEQFLLILQMFNVGASAFVRPEAKPAPDAALQNVLARLGALHLNESDELLPSERLEELDRLVCETLLTAESPRLITALAPVLVRNADKLDAVKFSARAAKSERLTGRLRWLIENTRAALTLELTRPLPREWARLYRRADVRLALLEDAIALRAVKVREPHGGETPLSQLDVLDADIVSEKSLAQVARDSSPLSRRFLIATALQPEDFADALRGAREAR